MGYGAFERAVSDPGVCPRHSRLSKMQLLNLRELIKFISEHTSLPDYLCTLRLLDAARRS